METSFDCTGTGDKCIALSRVCDGRDDCGGHEDEAAGLCRNKSMLDNFNIII